MYISDFYGSAEINESLYIYENSYTPAEYSENMFVYNKSSTFGEEVYF